MQSERRIPSHDLLSRPLDEDETELFQIYERLKALAAREDLAPCVTANVRQAMVMLWNVCVDLNLTYEELRID